MPASAVQTLSTTGVQLGMLVDAGFFNTIGSSSRSVDFQHEWLDAPSMTMLSMGPATAANVDRFMRLSPGVAPIETEFAVCDSKIVAGVQQQIPPNAAGKWSPIVMTDPGVGSMMVNRIKGSLTQLSIVPVGGDATMLGNTFNLSVTLTGLSVGLGIQTGGIYDMVDGYTVDIASASISCTAMIRHDTRFDTSAGPSACGEQQVACVPGTTVINITPPTTNLPNALKTLVFVTWNLFGVPSLTDLLETGVAVHFEHLNTSALGFLADGTLMVTGTSTLMPDGTSVCSPNALVPPRVPPTRALVQVHSYDGAGETRSIDGFVRSYIVRPYMFTDLTARNRDGVEGVAPLLTETRLYPGSAATQAFGKEFGTIDQQDAVKLTTSVRADRFDSECWTPDTGVGDILRGVPRPVVVGWLDGNFRKSADIERSFTTRKFRVRSARPADPAEVQVAMKSIGQTCGTCTGFWRIDGMVGAPNYPATWPIPDDGAPFDLSGIPPYEGRFWLRDDPTRFINDLLKCDSGFHAYKDEVVLKLPEIRHFDSLFDSTRMNSMSYAARGNSVYSTELTFRNLGVLNRMVVLQPDCWRRGVGSCWRSDLIAPPKYTVAAWGGSSGTTIPRLDPRVAMSTNMVTAYSSGTSAPWGYFDRSQLDLYTSVPLEYARANVTTTAWDWRGHLQTDWKHTASSYPVPTLFRSDRNDVHMGSSFEWWGVQTFNYPRVDEKEDAEFDSLVPYRPDFATDQLMVRRRNAGARSFCVAEEALTATIDAVRFKMLEPTYPLTATTPSVLVPANEIFAPYSTDPVRVIGSTWAVGPASPYFNH